MVTTTPDEQSLLDIGFEEAGHWILENGHLRARITKHGGSREILYAFVSEREVLYIGKSANSLAQRMAQYEQPGPTQKTNIRNNAAIKGLLEASTEVRILVFVDPEPVFFRGIRVNLAAGLEDELIRKLLPSWNKLGKGRPVAALSSGKPTIRGFDMRGPTASASEWNTVVRNVKPGMTIRNWSQRNGYLEGSFTVTAVHANAIEVNSPSARNIQTVHRQEFEKVLAVWDGYLTGEVPRYRLRDMTRFSTYVISMLRHLLS